MVASISGGGTTRDKTTTPGKLLANFLRYLHGDYSDLYKAIALDHSEVWGHRLSLFHQTIVCRCIRNEINEFSFKCYNNVRYKYLPENLYKSL